ncbi:laccase domain-containing protein [Trueperella pecoris]|uniref:Laccase domain-containing protein n=1 Tax=Trueperella pecoris TaxID=2733571 RepID=A0A7M1R2C2_9ACTO|nr:polyphenol oxidase family protein [Trueperella pecoris]QOR48440.1 laccase domain-containing protein [Trueperella pecoris]
MSIADLGSIVDWCSPASLPEGARAGFTSRRGGRSGGGYASLNLGFHVGDDPGAVRANRHLLEEEVGQEIVWMDQVHGATVVPADRAERDATGFLSVGAADAIVVGKGQAAAVMVADCVPLILVALDGSAGAVVHVGRAGLDLAIASRVLDELGSEVRAILGRSICGRCYEVPPAMVSDIASRWPGVEALTSAGTPGLDIPAGLEAQLRADGVVDIVRSQACTYETASCFSHRRASHGGSQTGRFAGILQIS